MIPTVDGAWCGRVGVGVELVVWWAEGPLSPVVRSRHREVGGIEFREHQPVWRAGDVKPRTAWLTAW